MAEPTYSSLTVVTKTTCAKTWADGVRDSVILRFADASSRDAILTAPYEGQFAWLKDVDLLTKFDGTYWRYPEETRVGFVSGAAGAENTIGTAPAGSPGTETAIMTVSGVVCAPKSSYRVRLKMPHTCSTAAAQLCHVRCRQTTTGGTQLCNFSRFQTAGYTGQTLNFSAEAVFINNTAGSLTRNLLVTWQAMQGNAIACYGNADSATVEVFYAGPDTKYPDAPSVS